jgi:phosphoribosylaminoimidazolecarboxamide formyltransferase / IMP cyclohydrolase
VQNPRRRLALLSVHDKAGIIDLARSLTAAGFTLLSTGGTARTLSEASIPVTEVSDHTGFPEMLDGRVKTLHPRIHGGLLARRDRPDHMAALRESEIEPIELVVVNLYPFEATAARAGATREEIVEMIDIGGPSMIRSAAKNHRDVTVVVDPADYSRIDAAIRQMGSVPAALREELAAKAFARTAAYDAAIHRYLSAAAAERLDAFPPALSLAFEKVGDLRYGENPHQAAAFYREPDAPVGTLARAEQIHGKELSFNNLLDLDSAWRLVGEFSGAAAAVIKHNNPCGAALGERPAEAFARARDTDPLSAFGGVVALNRPLDVETAREIGSLFLEAIIAPSFQDEALEILRKKTQLRLLRAGADSVALPGMDFKRVTGGMLLQTWDRATASPSSGRVVTRRAPGPDEMRDLDFAWRVAKHVRSNAIVYASGGRTLGIGAGQMSRVDSARIGAQKALSPLKGSVLASDAFFPFRDGIDAAAEAGVAAVVQPGGSIRDAEIIAAADEHGMCMIFTGERHFKH